MQLEDEVVEIRAHPDDDLANELDLVEVLGINRAVSDRACRKEEILVALGNTQPHSEAARSLWHCPRLGNHARHGNLPLPLRPDDGVDAGLDDAARVGIQGDLSLISRLHLPQLVLTEQGDDLVLVFDKSHDR